MFVLGLATKIYVTIEAVDMRKGFDGLYGLVRDQLGQDPRTGFRVAVGQQKAAAERLRELHGESVVWITPDEVAVLLVHVEAFKPIAAVKRLFPGAEIVDLHTGDPAKGDDDMC